MHDEYHLFIPLAEHRRRPLAHFEVVFGGGVGEPDPVRFGEGGGDAVHGDHIQQAGNGMNSLDDPVAIAKNAIFAGEIAGMVQHGRGIELVTKQVLHRPIKQPILIGTGHPVRAKRHFMLVNEPGLVNGLFRVEVVLRLAELVEVFSEVSRFWEPFKHEGMIPDLGDFYRQERKGFAMGAKILLFSLRSLRPNFVSLR